MAISPDLSDPLDDAKGGISLWGRWLQDRDEQVVLKLRVATGTKGRAVRVDFKSASLKVAVNAEVCMDGTLSAQAARLPKELKLTSLALLTPAGEAITEPKQWDEAVRRVPVCVVPADGPDGRAMLVIRRLGGPPAGPRCHRPSQQM